MVSESKVNYDLNTVASLFSSYNSTFNNISSTWRGTSYEKLMKAAQQFSEEYYEKIKKQLDAFGKACNLYAKYEVAKKNGQTEKVNDYKRQIENELLTASGIKLDATNYYGSDAVVAPVKPTVPKTQPRTQPKTQPRTQPGSNPTTPKTDPPSNDVQAVIQRAINVGIAIANDNTHGYSQQTRWGNPNYDCSSLVITCYNNAGLPVKKNGASYTGNMRIAFTKCGFIWIPGQPSMANLQPGDVLLDQDRHTEMYIGNGMNVGAHSNYDKRDGDSSGREISVSKYSSGPWDGVLRYVGRK